MADASVDVAEAGPHLRLADAVEALSEGFAVFDETAAMVLCNSRFRLMNPAMADLLVPGVTWEILVREAAQRGLLDAEQVRQLRWIESRLEPGADESVEVEALNGSIGIVTLCATSGGGFVVTQRDVTARRRLERQDREAEMLLRKVLEACPSNLVMSRVDDGEVLYRSPSAAALLGAGRNAPSHFASRDERADFITALLPNGRVDGMRVTLLHPDGTPFPASVSARMIEYRGEDVMVSAIVDMTREVALRAELEAQRETIFQNEKLSALGELLAGVAHELNNPLSVVVGHAMMLREEASDPDVLRRIDKIGAAGERCARIVKSFLGMARQEPAVMAPVDLDAAITAGLEAARAGSGLRVPVTTTLAGGLPRVMADADQMAQVVLNLVMNADQAIAATGRGDRIEVSSRLAADGAVEIRVGDNGPGIPAEIRGRIFEPFFTTKEVGEGTGLGLALCYRVVTSHRGRIAVEPRPGGGSVFVVGLPPAPEVAVVAPEPVVALAEGQGARVLVVDDEPDVAELIREILSRQGFEVEHAGSGEAALALIRRHDYAVILSDLAMPGLDGRGLYAALGRERPVLQRRVGFVTGDTAGPAAHAFLAATGRPRLEKPIAPDELRALVAGMAGP